MDEPIGNKSRLPKSFAILLLIGSLSVIVLGLFISLQKNLFVLNPRAGRIPEQRLPIEFADWRFGMGLETWNYSKVHCYTDDPLFTPLNGHREEVVGQETPCAESYMQLLRKNVDGMKMTSTQNPNWKLNPKSMNVSAFTALDPSANVQMIWYHYVTDTNAANNTNPTFTQSQLSDIYAHSDAPGSTNVLIVHNGGSWKMQLPKINTIERDYREYPICEGCIYKADTYKSFLQENSNFVGIDLGNGTKGWYTFYILAEVEANRPSHHLTPQEFAAVINEYVTTISQWFPNKRASFIPGSPTHLETIEYQQYYRDMYPYLLPEVKNKLNLNALDIFISYSNPDSPYASINIQATADEDLQITAIEFNEQIKRAARFFYDLTHEPSVLTQTSVLMAKVPHPPTNIDSFSGGGCPWCQDNEDAWKTTDYTAGRLTQLAYRQLKAGSNPSTSNTSNHVTAWAWWQGQRTQYWYEPMANRSWGGITSGVQWLASIDNCQKEVDYRYRHEPPIFPTDHPLYPTGYLDCAIQFPGNVLHTTVPGDVYLGMANGDYTYRPANAPSWWPKEKENACYFRAVANIRDVDKASISDSSFTYQYTNYSTPTQTGNYTFGQDKEIANTSVYRALVKGGYVFSTLTDIPTSFRGIKSALSITFPANSRYTFDHAECEGYNYKTGLRQGCEAPRVTGVTTNPASPVQATQPMNVTIDCNTNAFYTWYFKKN